MRFLHLGDLHIGKRVNEKSMLEDQIHILKQLVQIATENQVSAVLIAGDVFDKSVPSTEALDVCEAFLADVAKQGIPLYVIAGNHDSAERLSFGSTFMAEKGVHIAKAYRGSIPVFEIKDEAGTVYIHLLPFVKPTHVRMAYPDQTAEVVSHNDAVRIALEHHSLDTSKRNILVAHQFVVDGEHSPDTCESETISVGGIDSVQAALFDGFDYVALGHLHGAQHVRRPQVRYCGTPLKYSFSESKQVKTATIVDIDATGEVDISTRPLTPLHDMRELKASWNEIKNGCDAKDHDDYLHITLTDNSLYDAAARLRSIYKNLLRVDFAAMVAKTYAGVSGDAEMNKSPQELFVDFYQMQTGNVLTESQRALIAQIIAQEVE